jgi:hypothetical protein
MKLKLQVAHRSPWSHPSFGLAFASIMYGTVAESGLACAIKVCCVQHLRCARFLTATVVAGAIALTGCTSDGTPASTGNSDSIGSLVRNLFRSKSEAQPPVAQNEALVEPSAPKIKSATSKPKTVAAAPRAKLRSRQPITKTVTEVAKPSPKRQASAEPQSAPESPPMPPLLSGAAPTLPTGSFDNRVGSRR